MKKIVFFELDTKDQSLVLQELSGHIVQFVNGKLDSVHVPPQDALDAEVISVFVGSAVTKEVIALFPKLTFIATRSTGFDHIDLVACKERGIIVSNVPTYGTSTVAEYAFALLLTLSRKMYTSIDQIRETGSFALQGLTGFDLKGKRIGIIGTGNIGREAIRIAKGFLMDVVAFDAYPRPELAEELSFRYTTLDELLGIADVISIHVPYMPATHHLLNEQNLQKVKRGAILINTARGAIVDTNALVRALADGRLGGAGLDVLEEEGAVKDERELATNGNLALHDLKTIMQDHVLIDMPNVVITPHNAFNSIEALREIMDVTLGNIRSFIEGNAVHQVT